MKSANPFRINPPKTSEKSDSTFVTIGTSNRIQHGAVLGGPPQDLGYQGGAYTALEIGSHNRIGEFVSINVGTAKGGGTTRIGDHNFIMAYTHIGHDCQLADHIVIVNGAQFAGHVTIEHHALFPQAANVEAAQVLARDPGADPVSTLT